VLSPLSLTPLLHPPGTDTGLHYSTVPRSAVFNFEQHRQGRPYYPDTQTLSNERRILPHLAVRPATAYERNLNETRRLCNNSLTIRHGAARQQHADTNGGDARALTRMENKDPPDVRIQRPRVDERVCANDPAAIAVQVFLCRRDEYAVTTAQERADEKALRDLLISFLISRLGL